jgi:diguanylate cyclase (GGDEF)-like protein
MREKVRRRAERVGARELDVDLSPLGLMLTHRLLEVDPVEGVRRTIVESIETLVRASFVRLWERDDDGFVATAQRGVDPTVAAVELEHLLLELPGPSRSTLDVHGDARLDELCRWYRGAGRLCYVRPLRAFGTLAGAVAFHCADRAQLLPGELEVLRRYPDSAAVALRNAYVRDELRRLAFTDPLTGLANRRAIEDLLQRYRARERSILFVDFDGLKAVNDLVSYEAGDAVIKAVGDALKQNAREDWVPGRLGGDEFLVVLLGDLATGARTEAELLSAQLEVLAVPSSARAHFRGASVGWATAGPDEEDDALVRRAAASMKAQKTWRR